MVVLLAAQSADLLARVAILGHIVPVAPTEMVSRTAVIRALLGNAVAIVSAILAVAARIVVAHAVFVPIAVSIACPVVSIPVAVVPVSIPLSVLAVPISF